MVNKHNCVYYSTHNPHLPQQRPLNDPGVTVWGGKPSFWSFGPRILPVNGTNYLEMLKDVVIPELEESYDLDDVIWMQYGAPAHYAISVRNFLNEKI